ncbi:MAG: argininosuccinate synthase, partial [Nitrososphaerota archaeon]|nr:argininosuccinate synthase [Nitrososphaerota archaeon]
QGSARVVARKSPFSLLAPELATYGRGSKFDQKSAIGFIELWGLQSRVAAGLSSQVEGKRENGHPRTKAKEAK